MLQIKISGKQGAGKSRLATLIARYLVKSGYGVAVPEDNDLTLELLRADLAKRPEEKIVRASVSIQTSTEPDIPPRKKG